MDGRNRKATISFLRWGFFWLVFSILFDYSTSWIMMTLKGPSSEGNLYPRQFFQDRTLATFFALIAKQWTWILFILIGAACLIIATNEKMSSWVILGRRGYWFGIGILITWLFAVARMMLGPSTNVAAIFYPNSNFATFLSLIFGVTIALHFFWLLRKSSKKPKIEGALNSTTPSRFRFREGFLAMRMNLKFGLPFSGFKL